MVARFTTWEMWDGEVPALPGENDNGEYKEGVAWPGPPEPTGPLQNFTRAREQRHYHRAFYDEHTRHFLMRQEACRVTNLTVEERKFFGMSDSPETAVSDSLPEEDSSSVEPGDTPALLWPPGSPVWPPSRAIKQNAASHLNTSMPCEPPSSEGTSQGRNPWGAMRGNRRYSPARYATEPYPLLDCSCSHQASCHALSRARGSHSSSSSMR